MTPGHSERQAQALAKLLEAIRSAIQIGESIQFDKGFFQHQLVVGTFLAMTEVSDSIHILIENDKTYDAEILLRTLMELRVRLEVFKSHKDLADREQVEFVRHNCETLKNAKKGNKYLAKVAQRKNIEIEIEAATKTLEDLNLESVKGQLNFEQMCKKLGNEDEYAAIYRKLSQAPHGTYSSIIKRNFVIDRTTDDFSVVGFRCPEIESVELVAEIAVEWLTDAEIILTEFLKSSHIKQQPG